MRVGVVNNFRAQNIAFGNLTKDEKEAFVKTKNEALNVIGSPKNSVFIYSSACLPQSAEGNTGTGTLISKQGDELLDVIKTFTTANVVQDLPSGELLPKPPKNFYCAYEASSDALSTHLIEPEALMDERFGKIIAPEDLKAVVDANNGEMKDVLANFENVVEPDSPFENMLKKAHERFLTGEGEKLETLRKEFVDYNTKNADWLESHSIYDVLSKKYNNQVFEDWPEELDKRLFDTSFPEDQRIARKNEILKESASDIEFYKFKNFMADKCLDMAREKAHEKGFKFGGDVAYQFSLSDIYGNPKAFSYDVYMGPPDMKIPALNFYEIGDPNSAAAKMLAQKVKHAAQRYDTLRFDVGWGYVTPMLENSSKTYSEKKEMGSQVLDFIENTIKEVKGDNFNKNDIFYEVEAAVEDFRAFNDDGSIIAPLKDRVKIYSSDYMNDGWGSYKAYTEKFNLNPSEILYGAVNQDTTPLAELASNSAYAARKADQVKALSDILKIDSTVLQSGDEFIRAKNAEPLLAKNTFMFFTQFFGTMRKFNAHNDNGAENFAVKMPVNPEQAYYDAVKEGKAYNLMDGLEKVFKMKGFDQQHPELFAEIVKFKNKLYGITPEIKSEPVEPSFQGVLNTEHVANAVESSVADPGDVNINKIESQRIQEGAEVISDVSPSSSKPATETVGRSVKKNRYMKPALIIAGILVAGYSAYKLIKYRKTA